MTLLRAMDAVPEPPAVPPVRPTMESLGGGDTPRSAAHAFPLIEALELPNALPLRRAAVLGPPPPLVEEPPPPPSAPPILSAVEVDAPLAELFRLLAAGPAAPDEAFAALRVQRCAAADA